LPQFSARRAWALTALSLLLVGSNPASAPALAPDAQGTNPVSVPAAQAPAEEGQLASPSKDERAAANKNISKTNEQEGTGDHKLLKGSVTASPNPFIAGAREELPKGAQVSLSLKANLNSEISQKGDEVWSRVSIDVLDRDGHKVLLPGGWYAHGMVLESVSRKRQGRDGYLEIEFDKLVSPNGDWEVPFNTKLSTKDHALKTVAKQVAISSGYMGVGAFAGALTSVQMTGLPVAIATQGYSVAIGAGAGAAIGAIAAAKRKGKIASFYPGDRLKLTVSEPITLPGFNPAMLPSAKKVPQLKDLNILVNGAKFSKDPFGDSRGRLLTVDLTLSNKSNKEYSLFDLAVVSESDERYYPSIANGLDFFKKKVEPNSSEDATVSFNVESPKRKYWLVLLDRSRREELTRVPIN